MKKLALILTLVLSSLSTLGQEPALVFSRFIKDTPDTVWCDLHIWKKMGDGTYVIKTKRFHDQTMLSLNRGEYVFQYWVCDNVVFTDQLVLRDDAETVIMNILLKPETLARFDFSRAVYADPILYDFIGRRYSYIEF